MQGEYKLQIVLQITSIYSEKGNKNEIHLRNHALKLLIKDTKVLEFGYIVKQKLNNLLNKKANSVASMILHHQSLTYFIAKCLTSSTGS